MQSWPPTPGARDKATTAVADEPWEVVHGAIRQHMGGAAQGRQAGEGRRGDKAGIRQEERDLSVKRCFRRAL